jgi:hypothetical protein
VLLGFLLLLSAQLWYFKRYGVDLRGLAYLLFAAMFIGGSLGFWSGEYWWRQIYVLKRYPKKWAKYIK